MKRPLPRRLSAIRKIVPFLVLFCFFLPHHPFGQPTLTFTQLADGFSGALDIKNAGDGSNRLFIVEQGGLVKIYKKGKVLNQPFLDLRKLMGVGQFQGIWSIAFSPKYATNRSFYVLYTDKQGITALARYKVSSTNPDSALPNSRDILLQYPNAGDGHYGNLSFGKDGYLYVSLGAGGNNKLSQNGQSDFGKMLRLQVDLHDAPYYAIPADNPFVGDPDVVDEVWALGLRNAWRYSFDSKTGDMWIADVGQDSVEEIDYRTPSQGLRGSNFGWECFEGSDVYNKNGCLGRNNYIFPIFEYHHDIPKGGECVIGGYVYRGSAYPSLNGYYVCVDFISANSWKIKPNNQGGWDTYFQGTGIPKGIASFGVDEAGELYAISQLKGIFYKVGATSSFASIGSQPTGIGVTNGLLKSFVYPTLITNHTVILDLKELYHSIRLVDMSGNEIMKQDLSIGIGTTSVQLPPVDPGMYIIQLVGSRVLQQKVYISK